MSETLTLWEKRYQSMQRALRVSQASLYKGTAYIYRVGNLNFEAAFALFLTYPEKDWRGLVREAIHLFNLSLTTNDCQPRRDYPFNLARLYLEWHLGQWFLGDPGDINLLNQSINTYVEGLWGKSQQPLSALAVLPMGFLIRRDWPRLESFWKMLAERVDPSQLPPELVLWHRWSELIPVKMRQEQALGNDYLKAYTLYSRQIKDPTSQPAKFYLAVAKISQDVFGLKSEVHAVLSRLAVEPWEMG